MGSKDEGQLEGTKQCIIPICTSCPHHWCSDFASTWQLAHPWRAGLYLTSNKATLL